MLERGEVRGRFGGAVVGKDLNLTLSADSLDGRFGGMVDGKDIHAQVSEQRLEGRIGGGMVGYDLVLERRGDQIVGRAGGPVLGFDMDLSLDEAQGALTGRYGGAFDGKDINFLFEAGFPPLVAAALGAAVFYELREEASHSTGGGAH